ncbi:DUF928 domain-containing protein [Oscillatoriales cyanobacterium LEGE 11467]|uniref:DUF928 domain-containing protein n=1 Tax=Zarconia navalis LEGE 11467 TaxID=1828826 RepID=A0A928Z7B5_9CYAN|nr:DUF928 domain-containing protein [Zarconia navalis]MBE9039204.1 DUF928 domain-containing protein [Zarconia navalis LEGE 11467]
MSIEKICLHLPISLAVLALGGTMGDPVWAGGVDRLPSEHLELQSGERHLDDLAYQVVFESPPGRSAPSNSVGGGTRSSQVCNNRSTIGLTLLLPQTGLGLTVDSHPAFFVYVPDSDCNYAEFSLFEEDGDQEIVYETRFSIPNAPGIVKVELPEDSPSLEVGQNYSWYVSLALDESSEIDVRFPFAAGTIERVEADSELIGDLENATPLEQAAAYGTKGVWHETIAILAELLESQPNNIELQKQWEDLLQSEDVGLATIAGEPIVECCNLESSDEAL